MKFVLLYFLNILLGIPVLVTGNRWLHHPGKETCTSFLTLIAILIAFNLFILALEHIKKSDLSEIAKPCWTALILLFPIFGAISAFAIIENKKPNQSGDPTCQPPID